MRNLHEQNLLGEIRRVVWKRKLLILAVFLPVVISGAFATFLITPKYEAEMSLFVSRQRVDPQISAGERSADITLNAISDEEFNSELELLKNNEVITGAARELNLANDHLPKQDDTISLFRQKTKLILKNLIRPGASDADAAPDEFEMEKVANRINDNLDVEPVKKSRIIKITYTDTEPLRAKKTLEAIYEKYIALRVQMNDKKSVTTVFDKQSAEFDRKLKKSTDALKSFDKNNGVTGVEINSQSDILLRQYYETQKQSDQAKTEIDETEQRVKKLKEQIAAEPKQIQTGSVSKYVGALDAMKNDLIALNQERTKLLQKYKPGARFITEIEDRISNLEKAIARETANPPQERSYALNDLRRRLESDLSSAQINLTALRTRAAELQTQAETQRAEAARLNIKSIERDQIERERKLNEEAYLLYEKKARESEVGNVLNRQQVLNVSVADPPRTDGEKKSPNFLLNLLVLFNLGAIAGLAGAFAAEKLFTTREERYVLPLPPLDAKKFRRIPLLPDERKKLSPRRRKTPRFSEAVPMAFQTFADDEEDEKLSEIANYFRQPNSTEENV